MKTKNSKEKSYRKAQAAYDITGYQGLLVYFSPVKLCTDIELDLNWRYRDCSCISVPLHVYFHSSDAC